ncbi:DNA-binding response regulator [Bdellovibrio sp. qaytius]|nr:DNA-binding response regulator [Bdellovibrio sp. qaytius]
MNKVVIIDDLVDSCSVISEILSPYFECKTTSESYSALDLILEFKPNIVLMDYQMPRLNGAELCKNLKDNPHTKDIPIIFMSGVATEDERVETLELGGDDFIAKPFHPKELILRLKKRIQGYTVKAPVDNGVVIANINAATLTVGNLKMNLNSRLVYVNEREITLTPKQFEILKLLIENQNHLVSRSTFMEEVWGHFEVTPRNVDSQINYLKKKIDGFQGIITAVPSFGYRLDHKNS